MREAQKVDCRESRLGTGVFEDPITYCKVTVSGVLHASENP